MPGTEQVISEGLSELNIFQDTMEVTIDEIFYSVKVRIKWFHYIVTCKSLLE